MQGTQCNCKPSIMAWVAGFYQSLELQRLWPPSLGVMDGALDAIIFIAANARWVWARDLKHPIAFTQRLKLFARTVRSCKKEKAGSKKNAATSCLPSWIRPEVRLTSLLKERAV
jgi:hypothetical protein